MSEVKIRVQDKTSNGKVLDEIDLTFQSNKVTVKEIIETRVIQEVKTYNKKKPEYFHGLVQPLDAEKTLNGYKLKTKKEVDPEKQVYIALDAFKKNNFFVLIDSYQSESLDQVVTLKADTEINFLKLTPLVGG
jgi:hypothetical protein